MWERGVVSKVLGFGRLSLSLSLSHIEDCDRVSSSAFGVMMICL
jgi:hypothetical protein